MKIHENKEMKIKFENKLCFVKFLKISCENKLVIQQWLQC